MIRSWAAKDGPTATQLHKHALILKALVDSGELSLDSDEAVTAETRCTQVSSDLRMRCKLHRDHVRREGDRPVHMWVLLTEAEQTAFAAKDQIDSGAFLVPVVVGNGANGHNGHSMNGHHD
jgi:hypothetical protein